jgi:glutamate carboxypeptidase
MRQYLEENLPFYLDLLQQMVRINSFSSNPAGVDELGRLTAEIFAALDFTAETVPADNAQFGHHLVLTRPGHDGRKVGFVSHLDTVFPLAEERQNDFRWREEGKRIYGPGTVDIKGGTVVMYMMLDALRTFAPQLFAGATWVLLLDAAEEAWGADFGRLCRERLQSEDTVACLIFEGGYMGEKRAKVVVARKGMAVYRLEVQGRAAHAGSSHENGANAIVQLAQLIQKVAGFTDYERDLTFNVGTVAGGTVVNRVPHRAVATVEMRAFADEVYHDGLQRVMALPEQASIESAAGDYRCQIEIEVTRKTQPWPRNPATDRLLHLWQETGRALGIEVVPEERGGLSDGNFFWDAIPSLDGLGASGGNAHCSERSADGSKDQEFVSRDSFVPKALLNTMALIRLLEG